MSRQFWEPTNGIIQHVFDLVIVFQGQIKIQQNLYLIMHEYELVRNIFES